MTAASRVVWSAGAPLGLLALQGDRGVGWVALAPIPDYPGLARSQVSKPVDRDEDLSEVWSVTCSSVHRAARRQGVADALLAAAVEHAREAGARVVEGCPVGTEGVKRDSGSLYQGTLNLFLANGFELVERRGTRRALVRRAVA
ncbi:GNAT family N-acetyltransferase [Allokutzneria oryzae]|uniref:GNAT family N-acetyltransferase n=1 Tax=Allokutzneria oryzae TaxID=1378989 RepID=A0ABV5ZV11_9PSEU